jgi:RNA polymerase sigma factor (sigma-70 family)
MGCLDQDQRLLIDRKYFQQLTNVEIGKIMGVSREAVRMQLKRALAKMRRFSKE